MNKVIHYEVLVNGCGVEAVELTLDEAREAAERIRSNPDAKTIEILECKVVQQIK